MAINAYDAASGQIIQMDDVAGQDERLKRGKQPPLSPQQLLGQSPELQQAVQKYLGTQDTGWDRFRRKFSDAISAGPIGARGGSLIGAAFGGPRTQTEAAEDKLKQAQGREYQKDLPLMQQMRQRLVGGLPKGAQDYATASMLDVPLPQHYGMDFSLAPGAQRFPPEGGDPIAGVPNKPETAVTAEKLREGAAARQNRLKARNQTTIERIRQEGQDKRLDRTISGKGSTERISKITTELDSLYKALPTVTDDNDRADMRSRIKALRTKLDKAEGDGKGAAEGDAQQVSDEQSAKITELVTGGMDFDEAVKQVLGQ